MKIALAIGGPYNGTASKVYEALIEVGLDPAFIVYCFPPPQRIDLLKPISTLKDILVWRIPLFVLKNKLRSWLPDVNIPVRYVRGINSPDFAQTLSDERPDVVVVLNCGIVGKKVCELFPSLLLNVHAGKLPDYRGRSNVEWAYLEDTPLVGTVHYIASGIDTGDIVYEEELKKLNPPTTIEAIRNHAFDQSFALVPKALKALEDGKPPRRQLPTRTTRYTMHPFLVQVLFDKLSGRTAEKKTAS